jgi:membrane protease YdiL (CAAX protease family)
MESKNEYPGLGHAVLLILAIFLFQVAFGIPLSIFGDIAQHPVLLAVGNVFAFVLVLRFGIQKNQRSAGEILPLGSVRAMLLLPITVSILGLGILLSELDNLLRFALPPPQWFLDLFNGLTDTSSVPWESFIALVIVAPLTEELFFRGLVLRGFLSRYSVPVSVLLSAFLFGLLHANPWQFFSATLLGIIFAWWFLRTRSLLPCLVGHSFNNSIVLFNPLLPFKIRGFNTVDSASAIQFQPLWLDLTGTGLLILGIWLFLRLTPKPTAQPVPTEGPKSDG